MNKSTDILIIGAGLAGLSAAYHLNREYLIVEKESRPGGLCRTERKGDFLFDYTGHLLHLKNPYTDEFIKKHLKDNLNKNDRRSWIFSKKVFTRYPFQKNTYGLPPETIKEIIISFVNRQNIEVKSFGDWILTNFGEGIAKHFMFPYNNKLWTVHPSEMTTDWMGGYVPNVTLEDIIDGALSDSDELVGYNTSFYYPNEGGIESLVTAVENNLDKNSIILGDEVVEILPDKKKAITRNGDEISYNLLINTSPLNDLVASIKGTDSNIASAGKKLDSISVYNINFAIKGERFKNRDWIYLPEPEFACYRIGFPTNFSDKIAPKGFTTVYTEVSYSKHKAIDKKGIRQRIINDMIAIGLIETENDIETEKLLDIELGYVIYNFNRTNALNIIVPGLLEKDIYTIGRYGKWEYSAMEDAILQGKELGDKLNKDGK